MIHTHMSHVELVYHQGPCSTAYVLTMCNSNSLILSNSSEEFQGIISWKSSLLSAKVRFVSLLTSAVFAEGLPASALTYRMLILSLFCDDAWTAGAFNPRHI